MSSPSIPPDAPAPVWWLGPQPPQSDGLTQSQAARALQRFGLNALETRAQRSFVLQFAARFGNPLVLTLLAASGISAALGELVNFFIILFIVLFSVLVDFVLEQRATHAAQKLKASVALRAQALRDGQLRLVPVTSLVPGDVVLLSAGDRVPADGRLLQARDFFVNQGLLTGEAFPVEKRPADLDPEATELQQAVNAAFMGSTVVSGSARLLVVATGPATALGAVAHSLVTEAAPTAFERGMHRFGLLVARLTLLLVMFVMLVNLLLHRPLLESFLFAVALSIGLTPELMPMVVSVTLSRGALRMAKRRVIVKRMAAIENLGAMDVLCTDKTGTLTEGLIRLERCIDGDGRDSARVLMLAYLNSVFETGLMSPLDKAILARRDVDVGMWRKVDEVPFDFERRRVSVLVDRGDVRWLVVKGAPDDVLSLCGRREQGEAGDGAVLDRQAREALRSQCHDLERTGLRVLGVAWKPAPREQVHADVRDERDLVFAGFAAFNDPPKAGAATALASLARSGVAVKIVTGDSELVTQHLCALLKIPVKGVLTGRELARMDDAALRAWLPRTNLFCRVNPTQKSRIILALRANGHVVGYLGDGVNDAPPLQSADVGISVDSAVDVAREVADMVMLEHDLAVLHEGVLEGRRTFGNVMKYIMMGTSSNVGNMVSMAGASLFLPFLPLLPVQILLNNLLYDLSQSALPLDRVDASDLRRPRALDMVFIRRYMALFGLISSAFDALTFSILLNVLRANEALFRTGWFIESLVSQVLVVFVIRTRGRPWASRPAMALTLLSLSMVLVALLLPFTPLGALFQLVPPPPVFFVWMGVLVLAYLALVELVKHHFLSRLAPHAQRRRLTTHR